jgi:hypothetical protein
MRKVSGAPTLLRMRGGLPIGVCYDCVTARRLVPCKIAAKIEAAEGLNVMRTRTIAAAMLLIAVVSAAEGHSWYDKNCCHDKDCHPVPCEEIEKIRDGWFWRDAATKQRHWFPHDRLKASHDDACHVCVSPLTRPSGICLYLPLPA